jgi:hypothetical protein
MNKFEIEFENSHKKYTREPISICVILIGFFPPHLACLYYANFFSILKKI